MTGAEASRDRARVYAVLAGLFRAPGPAASAGPGGEALDELRAALTRLGADGETVGAVRRLEEALAAQTPESLRRAYVATFDAAGGLRCPPNETAHTAVTPQHAMLRNFELADVAGFYRAFGVEVEPGTERPDHIAVELEFMHLLAVKELVAAGDPAGPEQAEICRDAQRAFLTDHLGRWSDGLGDRLASLGDGPFYAAAGDLVRRFVRLDAARMQEAAP